MKSGVIVHIDEIIVEENCAYDATAHLQPQADDGLYY